MKLPTSTTALLLTLVLVSRGQAADEKITLVLKATPGQVVHYKEDADLSLEAMGQKVSFQLKSVEKATFTDVSASGNITSEREEESTEVTVNGNKMPSQDRAKEKTTFVMRPDSTLVSYKSSTGNDTQSKLGARLYYASNPIFSDKPVGAGDKWSKDYKGDTDLGTMDGKADFEVVGSEKVGDTDALKIKMTYAETGANPVKASGTFLVEKISGDVVQSDLEVENVPFSGEGGPMASGKLHQERTDGKPFTGGAAAKQANGAKPDEKKPEPKKDKTIDETVKDYEKLPGVFTLYRKKESGRDTIYMEIKEEQLDKLALMQVTASTGTASQVVAGDPIKDLLFKFVKGDEDRLFLVSPNLAFRANDKTPIARSVKRSFADAILDAYKIEAKQPDRKSLLINVSELFKGDIAEISSIFSNPLGGLLGMRGGSYALDRDKTFVETIKNFPDNLFVETHYHFVKGGGRSSMFSTAGDVLADARSIPFKVNYNVFFLPDNGYKPRLADPRVGYFQTVYQDMNNDATADTATHYIYRWQMEKADPKAALSPPKKPIVFWLDNAIPLEYRGAVRDGLLFWNKAFERVGIKDAIVVKQMPDNADWDHADMRYNTIRWVSSPNAGYAVALFRVNPVTGQILNANITVDCNLVRYTKIERTEMVNPMTYFDEPNPVQLSKAFAPNRCQLGEGIQEQAWFGHLALDMLRGAGNPIDDHEYTNQFLREVVSHEMGHIMGLRHNFIASTALDEYGLANPKSVHEIGCTASVMDYSPFNIFAIKQKGVDFFSQTIGPYDKWAIEYGYTPIEAKTPEGELYKLHAIAAKCNEPGHGYQSDEVADQFDPDVVRFDLGRDPLAYWKKSLEVSRFLIFNLDKRLPKRGESYFEFTRNFEDLLGFYVRATAIASRFVGGLYVNRNHRGDPGEKPTLVPVPAVQQKQALQLMKTYLFAENAFAFPKSYYQKLTDEPYGFFGTFYNGSSTYPMRDIFANVQGAALRRLMNPAVLSRISNNEYKLEGTGAEALTLPTLFTDLRATIWSEVEGRRNISSLRRQLQRAHLDGLIAMFLTPSAGTPEDAKMLAWNELTALKSQIARARRTENYDAYTRVHLDESLVRINRALDAKQTLGGGGGGRPISLLDLLGGQNGQSANPNPGRN